MQASFLILAVTTNHILGKGENLEKERNLRLLLSEKRNETPAINIFGVSRLKRRDS